MSFRRAFTLIEVLVVIVIIGLLIAILLPALRNSPREVTRMTACSINFKSIGQAFNMYANDNKERIWECGSINNGVFRFWYSIPTNQLQASTGLAGTNPLRLGPAFQYLSHVDKVFECPANKRRAKTTLPANWVDQNQQNQMQRILFEEFLSDRTMNFDYTMVTGSSGAKISTTVFAAYDRNCRTRTAQAARGLLLTSSTSLERFKGVPVYAEEDDFWWNIQSPDGLWSNWDQISTRHGGNGHMVHLAGDVEAIKPPRGPNPDSQADIGDMVANDVYVSNKGDRWYQLAPTWPGTARPWGWLDSPR